MAKYRIARKPDGAYTIQARYRPFKRGRLHLKSVTVPRADLGKAAGELAQWVNFHRHPKATD